jgi:flagellar assembly factor FliW
MIVETARFGFVNVDPKSVIAMPRGMFGFEDEAEFCLICHEPNSAFRWFQSTTRPELAFVVVDPSIFFEDYSFVLSSVESEFLDLESPDDAMVLTTVRLARDSEEPSANLAGPIVINSKSLLGLQVALDDERWGTSHPLKKSGKAAKRLPKAA